MYGLNRLGVDFVLTDVCEQIRNADKLIIPGVGSAGSAMEDIRDKKLDQVIKNLKQPVLGICLGLQILTRFSQEDNTDCLGVFDTEVKAFPKEDIVPHMGWNNFKKTSGILFKGIKPEEDCYFVHSYFAEACVHTTAVTDYIIPFSAALEKDNFYATQFHPEKSSATGRNILKNFLEI
jgi:glutamine amidotransferase